MIDASSQEGRAERSARAAIHVPRAGTGLGLIMQAGGLVECLTGITLNRLLDEEFGIEAEIRPRLDVFFLDGKPVDEPDKAIVPDGSRLALAGGLPGIAGLAMRSGGPLVGMRPDITHRQDEYAAPSGPVPGRVEVALLSLALKLLAAHFLRRGVLVGAARLLPYFRPALVKNAVIGGCETDRDACREFLQRLPPKELIFLSADIASGENEGNGRAWKGGEKDESP